MKIKIGNYEITECWDGVFYKKLSHYPFIPTWEIQTILDFIRYEKMNGRTGEIDAEDEIVHAMDVAPY